LQDSGSAPGGWCFSGYGAVRWRMVRALRKVVFPVDRRGLNRVICGPPVRAIFNLKLIS
jgi:hypothetical protein